MKNSDYWKQRFEQLEQAQNSMGASSFADIEKQYKQAQKEIEAKIARWYQRFADNNSISMAEARKWLSVADLKEFKWDVQDYIKYGQENALDGLWMKELENASAKFHISKLEALKTQTQHSLESLFSKQLGTVQTAMGDVLQSGYFHTAYELQKGFGVGWDIAGIDQAQIEKILSKPWAADGYNFSERIWGNKNKLIDTVHKELTQNIMLGGDPQKAIDNIAKQMNTSKNNAGRLVMTEEAFFSSTAQRDCFNELDVEQYEIVATLDSRTSEVCRGLDGKVFDMKDFQPGVTAPPFHVYCRSTTVPYFNDDFDDPGERAARDENGETYYIPDDMNYKQWKETFVDGGDKSDLQLVEPASTSEPEQTFMDTKKFESAEEANEYFGKRPNHQLRRTNREDYDRRRKEFEKSAYGKWYGELDSEQTMAVVNYTGDDYSAINGLLRTEMTENQVKLWDSYNTTTTKENIDHLTDAISRFELHDNIQVYRTCEMDVFRNLRKNVGSVFVDDGFTSTSILKTPVASGNVRMVIDVPASKGVGAWISPLSGIEEEYEFLLQRGTRFRIDAIQETTDEIQIHMTVLDNDPKSEITFASKKDVIQLWKDKGVYDEEAAKIL